MNGLEQEFYACAVYNNIPIDLITVDRTKEISGP